MSAAAVSIAAVVLLGVAGISLACLSRGEGSRYLAALCMAVAASVSLMIFGLLLADGWAEWIDRFDFSGFEPSLTAPHTGGAGMLAIYAIPYEVIGLGALAAYFFGRSLYRRVRFGI